MNPCRSKHDKRCPSRYRQDQADPDRVAMHEPREQAAATEGRYSKPPPAVGRERAYIPAHARARCCPRAARGAEKMFRPRRERPPGRCCRTDSPSLLVRRSRRGDWPPPKRARPDGAPPAMRSRSGRAGGRRVARLASRQPTIAEVQLAGTALRGRRFSEERRLRSQGPANARGPIGADADEQGRRRTRTQGLTAAREPADQNRPGNMMRSCHGRGESGSKTRASQSWARGSRYGRVRRTAMAIDRVSRKHRAQHTEEHRAPFRVVGSQQTSSSA